MYYRVENNFLGYDITLNPKDYYEGTDDYGNVLYTENKNGVDIKESEIKETCFAKDILGAFYGKTFFLKEDHVYYIYTTTEIPDTDLSHNTVYDFAITQEVRYRRAIKAKLLGSVKITGFFIYNMNRIEEDITYTKEYNHEEGKKLLNDMKDFLNCINYTSV